MTAQVLRLPTELSTRDRLVDAAERLFSERGIEAVSLREITRESGARNAIAAQYHFEDRAGLVRAIMARHLPDVNARRHALLDAYEAVASGEPRDLAAAYVRPFAPKLETPSGRAFLVIHADVLNRPDPRVGSSTLDDPEDSTYRWRALIGAHLDKASLDLHRRFTAVLHAAVELARRAKDERRVDNGLFVSSLIDVVTAILITPPSNETTRLLAQRPATKPRRARNADPRHPSHDTTIPIPEA
jgi:AcrR family transcriptional regulator